MVTRRVPLTDIVRASTINAANAVRATDRGMLKPGKLADATVLELVRGTFSFHDVLGETMEAAERLECRGIVLSGRWWHGG